MVLIENTTQTCIVTEVINTSCAVLVRVSKTSLQIIVTPLKCLTASYVLFAQAIPHYVVPMFFEVSLDRR